MTTLASVDSTENIVEENQDLQFLTVARDEDVLEGEPSEIDQVFVKLTGESVEVL